METCDQTFYSPSRTLRRAWVNLWRWRRPLISWVANLSYRNNIRQSHKNCRNFVLSRAQGGAGPIVSSVPETASELRGLPSACASP